MRSDRPDPPRRGETRRMTPIGPALERLECRDLMALVVGPLTPVKGVLFSGKVASFAAADVAGTLADFKGTINWGDASAASPAVFAPILLGRVRRDRDEDLCESRSLCARRERRRVERHADHLPGRRHGGQFAADADGHEPFSDPGHDRHLHRRVVRRRPGEPPG